MRTIVLGNPGTEVLGNRGGEALVVDPDIAIRVQHHLEGIGLVVPLLTVGLGLPLDNYPLGVGLMLDEDSAVVVGRKVVVPGGNDRPATGGGQVEGVGGAGGGEPDVAVGVDGYLAVGLAVEGE